MPREWTGERVLEGARTYQSACVILAAAELGAIGALSREPSSARRLARILRSDERATTILADALTALGLLEKRDDVYSPAPGVGGPCTTPLRAHAGFNEVDHIIRYYLWGDEIPAPKLRPVVILKHWDELVIDPGELIPFSPDRVMSET